MAAEYKSRANQTCEQIYRRLVGRLMRGKSRLLDLAERWSRKISEGLHQFLTTRQLRQAVERHMDLLQHRTILMLLAGPAALLPWGDAVSLCSIWRWGFFQYIVTRKRAVL
jgi:hypothetical protein